MSEQVFFNQSGYKVTGTLVETPLKTYSLANITSIRTEQFVRPKSSVGGQVALIIIGGIAMIAGFLSDGGTGMGVFGLLVVGVGIGGIALRKQPPIEYRVYLSSASSEREYVSSPDLSLMYALSEAVKRAISARG